MGYASSAASLLVLASTVLAGHARAEVAAPKAARLDAPPILRLDVRRHRLENGLRVVIQVDHSSPTVAFAVVYDVGSRNEERGRSGFAHLLGHMMLQGLANVAHGDYAKLVTAHGGIVDESTTQDFTSYGDVLPSSELALGLWLEADRMKNLDVSRTSFERQRVAVKEEYAARIENEAYAPAAIRLRELAYQGFWPYEHPPIGTMRDLDAMVPDRVKAFRACHYSPNSAVVAIAGDVDEDAAMGLVRTYFGDARPAPAPRLELPPLPEQTQPRQAIVEDVHAKLPAVLMGWVVPPAPAPDHAALEVVAIALADGESSRLHRTLVRERGLAVRVEAQTTGRRGPDLFELVVRLAKDAKVGAVERVLEAELTDLARSGPSDVEMKRLRARAQTRFLVGLSSNRARAEQLAELELSRGDAGLLSTELDRILSVTRDDVKRVVATYLVPKRRSVVEVKPGLDGTPSGAKR